MRSRPPSAEGRRAAAGFTLIELMIGVVIGLLASLAVTHVLVNSEGQKRATTSGSDAQVNGALALARLQRGLLPAGYGFTAVPDIVGCELQAFYNSAVVPGFPTVLAPVTIVDGGATGLPDTIRILASGKSSFSVPLRIGAAYAAGATSFKVAAAEGALGGDLLIAGRDAAKPCQMFRATNTAKPTDTILRADESARWNKAGYPTETFVTNDVLINMGVPIDITYSIGSGSLRANTLTIDPADGKPDYTGAVEIFPGVVNLQALYGKDTDNNGSIDKWDVTTPAAKANADWLQIRAIRIAVVARSAHFEKVDVTHAAPQWDVGTSLTVANSAACGTSQCLPMPVDANGTITDWKRYRYRVFETVVPLRNMLWN
jgi:type IV pilus assembly protein PilW